MGVKDNFYQVAVLGSGVMGAQIAAHFANAAIPVLVFDLKSNSGDPNAIVNASLASLAKLKPQPLATSQHSKYLQAANYDDDLHRLSECDLIVEAVAERLDIKQQLFAKIMNYLAKDVVLASNTSGLSINALAASLPSPLQANFCGVHFFNPPRYMPLVELIPHGGTNPLLVDRLEQFLVTGLGKGVIRAKDTPNFIANRIGVFSLLALIHYADQFALPLEVVDQLTGKKLGRAKSATFRTVDVVGLDTLAHVVQTMADNCQDGFEHSYRLPQWLQQLIANGQLGQKSKAGVYRKDKDGIKVIDRASGNYVAAEQKADAEVLAILNAKTWAEKLSGLHASSSPAAKFLWSSLRDLFYYCACLVGEICDSPRQIDLALRRGFGWKQGPFEIWQQAGWQQITTWIKADLAAGLTLATRELPQWVDAVGDGVYRNNQHFNLTQQQFVTLNQLPVYQRQLVPELVLNEVVTTNYAVLYENPGVKLWDSGDGIGVISFKSKMGAIGMEVLLGLEQALAIGAEQCQGLVIWQPEDNFSVGANLEEFGFAIMMNGQAAIAEIITTGQRVIATQLRQSKIPVVAAVKGYIFGGGCEVMLHCSKVVAALESYIGLVEAGVGLLPGWGGSTAMVTRAAEAADPWADLTRRYQNLALAKVATSAYEAQAMGFLSASDVIVMNSREILLVAKEQARLLALQGYRPPLAPQIKVYGEQGMATISGMLVNMHVGGQISDHDYLIARNLAHVMCGGDVTNGSVVDREWLLKLELHKFSELALSDKTAERIQYMLAHGKPLRN